MVEIKLESNIGNITVLLKFTPQSCYSLIKFVVKNLL